MSEAEFETIVPQGTNITLQAYDTSETDKVIVEKDAQIAEPKADKYLPENDWNDVSNTKIPLNEEIFALLEDRQNPAKLRPAVIVARMMPANRLTWTESKEGDVLCYDVPAGNFHSCNGSKIKYWKHVNVPSKHTETSCGRERMKIAFTKMFETSIKSAVNESLAKIETACVTALDKFCQQIDPSSYDEH